MATAAHLNPSSPSGPQSGLLKSVYLVAAFDFAESLRSRKAIALLLLYIIGAAGGTGIFVGVLNKIQDASTLHIPPQQMLEMIVHFVGNSEIAKQIVSIPLVSLFYGWIALTFVPLLVVLTSSDAIAGEVASGSVRFALFRCPRLAWVCGKLAGQIVLMMLGILVGGLGSFLVGVLFSAGYPALDGVLWTLRLSLRAVFYGLPFLGLALAASQMTRSTSWARGLSLLALVLLAMAGNGLQAQAVQRYAPTITAVLRPLFPQTYWLDLWRPQLGVRAVASLALTGLALLYFAAGYWAVFSRRDR